MSLLTILVRAALIRACTLRFLLMVYLEQVIEVIILTGFDPSNVMVDNAWKTLALISGGTLERCGMMH
jgi:hypothetical protein